MQIRKYSIFHLYSRLYPGNQGCEVGSKSINFHRLRLRVGVGVSFFTLAKIRAAESRLKLRLQPTSDIAL